MAMIFYNIIILFSVYNWEGNTSLLEHGVEMVECSPIKNISIPLEGNYYRKENSYEEGVIVTFTFSDTSYVLVFCGKMQKNPMLNDTTYQVDKTCSQANGLKSRMGKNIRNNKFWREDNYKSGVTIIYDNVSDSDIKKFDSFLEKVKISE